MNAVTPDIKDKSKPFKEPVDTFADMYKTVIIFAFDARAVK